MSDLNTMLADINRAVSDEDIDLNEWETDFIESITKLVEANHDLTPRQEEKLIQIWEKTK